MAKIPGLFKRGEVYWYSRMVNGHRTRVSLGTTDLSKALDHLNRYRSGPTASKPDTIPVCLNAFLADKVKNDRFTESTRRAAIVSLKMFSSHVEGIAVSAITGKHLQRFYEKAREESSEATAQTHLARVRSFFNWCTRQKMIKVNPALEVRVGRLGKGRTKRFCTKEERDCLIASASAINPNMPMILYLGFHCGLRRGEISEARWEWFDKTNWMLHVRRTETFRPKDREERSIPISKAFRNYLEVITETHEAGSFVVAPYKSVRGLSIYRYDFRAPFAIHVKSKNLGWVTAHTMRHTFASLLASNGVSIYKIALWLGDDVRVVQNHYAKLLPGDTDIDRM